MREIKFRAWDKKLKRWAYFTIKDIWFLEDGEKKYQCSWEDYEDWGQFTGLKDKDGKEIYEGDIVQNIGMPEYQRVGIVEFEGGKFIVIPIKFIKDKKYKGDLYYWDEVIGNIYENPELLEDLK